jgi:ubiquinone/menaquinone biosynthesis C-methylase UbiE
VASLDLHREFADIDAAPRAPGQFISYLDTVRDVAWIAAVKRRSFALHEPLSGSHLLDVGCGTGDDALALAQIVGRAGHVVGVDKSGALIDEATRRGATSDLPVQFRVNDVHHLRFPDGSFDGCRADRTLQHVDEPRQAVTEMIRVVRSGGRISIVEADFDTLVIDASDRAVTRAIVHAICDNRRNGWLIRRMPALLHASGLTDIIVMADTWILTQYMLAEQVLGLSAGVARAQNGGMITADEAATWLADLARRSQAGHLFVAITGFLVAGQKP